MNFNNVYIAIGSNVGNRKNWIEKALHLIETHDYIELLNTSEIIETKAEASYPQPNFLNGAIHVQTILSPEELLTELRKIETACGRTTKGDMSPRTCDLDILLYDELIMSEDNLTVPHPGLHDRLFVLEPLAEIAPDVLHPILQETIKELYEKRKGY